MLQGRRRFSRIPGDARGFRYTEYRVAYYVYIGEASLPLPVLSFPFFFTQPLYIEPKKYFYNLCTSLRSRLLRRSSAHRIRPPSLALDSRRALSYHDPRPYSRLRHYRDSTLDDHDITPHPDT